MGILLAFEDIQRVEELINQAKGADTEPLMYAQEALCCLKVGAYRATVVQAWCIVIYYLHREVENVIGIQRFVQVLNKKHNKSATITAVQEMGKAVKDRELLDLLHLEFKRLDGGQYKELVEFSQIRNDSAHPSDRRISSEVALFWLRYAVKEFIGRSPDIQYLPASFIADEIVNTKQDLEDRRIMWLLRRARRAEYLLLVDRLLTIYREPSKFQVTADENGQADVEEAGTDPEILLRDQVLKVWKHFASMLDEQQRQQVNHKVASLSGRTLINVELRVFMFPEQFSALNPIEQADLIDRFYDELQVLFERQEYGPTEYEFLANVLPYAEGQARTQYEMLLTQMKWQLQGGYEDRGYEPRSPDKPIHL